MLGADFVIGKDRMVIGAAAEPLIDSGPTRSALLRRSAIVVREWLTNG
jgi:hypothetical protein